MTAERAHRAYARAIVRDNALDDRHIDAVVREKAESLYGYRGDRRRDRAHVIVRRKHIGMLSNDIGYRRQRDSTFLAVISD